MEWLREVYLLLETGGALVEKEAGLAAALPANRVVASVNQEVRSVGTIKTPKDNGLLGCSIQARKLIK